MSLLEVHRLKVEYPIQHRGFAQTRRWVRAVNDVSFDLQAGETLGLVGESGCGKTTLGRAIVRLIPVASGTIQFDGREITSLTPSQFRPLRRQLQIVFQDPYGSLNPRMNLEQIIGEALDIHGLADTHAARQARVADLLRDVGLDPGLAPHYPHEFSGGQRQRIGIARALAVEPRLLVCDEPVSALDVSVQAQIVNLLRDLQQRRGLAYLFITHDLAVVEHVSRRLLVMYLGRIVEAGDTRTVCRNPQHPYTQALLAAVPVLDPRRRRARTALEGEPPSPIHPPPGCPFHPRCPLAEPRCALEPPQLRPMPGGNCAACHRAGNPGIQGLVPGGGSPG